MKKVTAFRKVYIQDEPWSHLKHLADHFAQQGEKVLDNRGSPSLSATLRLLIERAYTEVRPVVARRPAGEPDGPPEPQQVPAAPKVTGKPVGRTWNGKSFPKSQQTGSKPPARRNGNATDDEQ